MSFFEEIEQTQSYSVKEFIFIQTKIWLDTNSVLLVEGRKIMMQYLMFFIQYLVFFIILFVISVIITLAITHANEWTVDVEGKTGIFGDWWKWINKGAPDVHLGKSIQSSRKGQEFEIPLCPNCGSMLSKQDVQRLDYGYAIECTYCGATIHSHRMNY